MAHHFKVGERVRFLHENQEGVIQAILSPRLIEVLVDDFLELEVSPEEIVQIHAAEATFLQAPTEENEPLPELKPEEKVAVDAPPSLAIIRTPNKDYEFWLSNQSTNEIAFTTFLRIRDKYQGIAAGSVPPKEKLYIGKSSSENFHRANLIKIQLLFFPHAGRIMPMPPFSMEVNVKKEIMNRHAWPIASIGGHGWEFILEEQKPSQLPSSDFARVTETRKPTVFSKPTVVYDLHIDKLVDNPLTVDSRTMLLIQTEHFERKLSEARLKGLDKIVFIHGVGVGTLKREIHRMLKEYDFVERFGSADPLEYGNGATFVELK